MNLSIRVGPLVFEILKSKHPRIATPRTGFQETPVLQSRQTKTASAPACALHVDFSKGSHE